MSNKASNSLFLLIKSLTKAEKRYFKIYTSRHVLGETNNYHIIFNAIDKLDEYNEDELKNSFKDAAFIKKFSIAKSRLYETILKSLSAFHSNISVDSKINKNLHFIEILFNRTLYKQSVKLLSSTRKLAEKHQRLSALVQIQEWEKRIIETENYTDLSQDVLNDMLSKNNALLDNLMEYNSLWNIKSRVLLMLNKKGKIRSEIELKAYTKIVNELKSIKPTSYYKNVYLVHQINSIYNFAIDNNKKSYESLQHIIGLVESNPELYKEEYQLYFSALTNVIYLAARLGKFKESEKYLTNLKELPELFKLNVNEELEFKIFVSVTSLELTLYNLKGEYAKAIEKMPLIENGLHLHKIKLSDIRKAYFYFQIASIYFAANNFHKSLQYVNVLLNDIKIKETEDIYCFAQLLSLLIHVEMKNVRLLPYAIKAANRSIVVRNKNYNFEQILIRHLKKLPKVLDTDKEQVVYNELYAELYKNSKNKFENSAIEYFDFFKWAKSKKEKVVFGSLTTKY